MAAIRHLNAADHADSIADRYSLPKGRITERRGTAHVFTAALTELEAWAHALGGHPTSRPAGDGVVMWTLDTRTHGTHGTPIRVQALALDTDLIDDDLTVA